MRRNPFRTAAIAVALAVGLALTGCGGDDKNGGDQQANSTGTTAGASGGVDKVQGAVASYDLAVGPASRFMLGIFNEADTKGPVGLGTASFNFFFLGEKEASGTPQPGPTATGTYLPLPGSRIPPGDTSKPVYLPTDQRGVYAADVAFDRPGFWGVAAVLELDGRQQVQAVFQVLPKHEVPFPGDPAPASQNLTATTPGAAPEAIDSRASATTPVPDAELHQTTVAQALAEKRPIVLVVSTPTYCVSRFCGPVTDVVADLAKTSANRARFVHVEVWKDYKAQQLNDAAKEWISAGSSVNEPWVFLIGADGTVSARYDNIASQEAVEAFLQKLPPMKG